jgi:hypothetical protein
VGAASPSASAGNSGNFVLYDHHTEDKGETELELLSDFARVGYGEPDYTAQLAEIEYGVTDLWTTSLYLEGAATDGDAYQFGSFRFENRVRVFKDETLFNPVLYVEYEQKRPASRFITSVVGRTDESEGPPATEHEIETKLILGHDLTDRLTVAFNWINEIKLDNGLWSFGYAGGLNYAVFKGDNDDDKKGERVDASRNWELQKLTLGAEFYGGVGDSKLGLTLDPDKTEHYAGLNLEAEFENHIHVGVGLAFGLTAESQNALLRTAAGYEF